MSHDSSIILVILHFLCFGYEFGAGMAMRAGSRCMCGIARPLSVWTVSGYVLPRAHTHREQPFLWRRPVGLILIPLRAAAQQKLSSAGALCLNRLGKLQPTAGEVLTGRRLLPPADAETSTRARADAQDIFA